MPNGEHERTKEEQEEARGNQREQDTAKDRKGKKEMEKGIVGGRKRKGDRRNREEQKGTRQDGLSRATLEISSEFSINLPLRTRKTQNIQWLLRYSTFNILRSSFIGGCLH